MTAGSRFRRAARSVAKLPGRAGNRLIRPIMGTITGVLTRERVAALTFDDGPEPQYTPHLLDILERHRAKATFFMVGNAAARHPEIVKRAAESGHAIGNHTWDHAAVPLIARRERLYQILACEQVLASVGTRLFRPPYGFQTRASYLDARALGYTVVGWSGTAEDWLDHPADVLLDRLADVLEPGSVILLHDVLHHTIADSYADRSALLDALDTLLGRDSGRYRFVTVPELLRFGRARKVAWFRPAKREWLNALANGSGRQY